MVDLMPICQFVVFVFRDDECFELLLRVLLHFCVLFVFVVVAVF